MSGIGGALARDSEVRLPKTMPVKNKAAAPRQITAEQLLRESKDIQLEDDYKAPKTIITDPEELAEYRCVLQLLLHQVVLLVLGILQLLAG